MSVVDSMVIDGIALTEDKLSLIHISEPTRH